MRDLVWLHTQGMALRSTSVLSYACSPRGAFIRFHEIETDRLWQAEGLTRGGVPPEEEEVFEEGLSRT